MKVSNRKRLLLIAAWLDNRSAGIRRYVKTRTPKRPRKEKPRLADNQP